ncbi:MAG: hypothetical protein DI637_01400 [Citromicrobium sp.]|nr:MAG: hypothetical protein DI637_01400 [Citromicrobium sp.]
MTQPVIILGAARSGTKYLRDILATSAQAKAVPYDINYIWRYGSEGAPDDVLSPELLTPRKISFIRNQVHRLAKLPPSSGDVLLEKTVSNTLRVPFCNVAFPDALFVHLVRDGRAVTESAMRQWQEPLRASRLFEKLKGLPLQNLGYAAWFGGNLIKGLSSGRGGGKIWGPRYPGITEDVAEQRDLVEICAKQWSFSIDYALEDLSSIEGARQITIRYDDLVGGTDALRRVIDFCNIKDADNILAMHDKKVRKGADTKWKDELDLKQQRRMMRIIEPNLHRLGYT